MCNWIQLSGRLSTLTHMINVVASGSISRVVRYDNTPRVTMQELEVPGVLLQPASHSPLYLLPDEIAERALPRASFWRLVDEGEKCTAGLVEPIIVSRRPAALGQAEWRPGTTNFRPSTTRRVARYMHRPCRVTVLSAVSYTAVT